MGCGGGICSRRAGTGGTPAAGGVHEGTASITPVLGTRRDLRSARRGRGGGPGDAPSTEHGHGRPGGPGASLPAGGTRGVSVTSAAPRAVSWSRASRADEAAGLKGGRTRRGRAPPAAGLAGSRPGGTLPAGMDARGAAVPTLLLANQHQFFSGKLYVLLQ
ncbi:myosin IC heavy chain-like [Passer montanus]|uniref:myosin IC heavy chain-like n=1 Tax=Passer montanus TaxID=9160 RepID=UPI00195FB6E3|nr:myosin IC heavy chain-like [Passer montanus]